MSRYGVYPNRGASGYLLDVQTDLLGPLSTRIVIPLLPLAYAPAPAKILNPLFDIGGEVHSMVTQYLAAVALGELTHPVFNAQARADEIQAALDFLFHGF